MITKTTMLVIFNSQNSHLLTLFLSTVEVFQVNGQKSASGKSSNCQFSFSAKRNANTKATEYVTFSFSFIVLVFFPFQESRNLTVCQQYKIFNVLAAIIRESSDKQLVLRIMKALLFIHQPDPVMPKASDVSAADWLY